MNIFSDNAYLSVLPITQQIINIPKIIYYFSEACKDYSNYHKTQNILLSNLKSINELGSKKLSLLISTIANSTDLAMEEEMKQKIAQKNQAIINTTKEIEKLVDDLEKQCTEVMKQREGFAQLFLDHTISLGDATQRSIPIIGTIYSLAFLLSNENKKN